MLAAACLAACTTATQWEARGTWSAHLTFPGQPGLTADGSVDVRGDSSGQDRIRLCEETSATFGFYGEVVRGEPAAIEIRTSRPLCESGALSIQGGTVLVWASPGQDTLVLSAMPSQGWTVSGEIYITTFEDQGLPDLSVGQSAWVERISGTATITATDGSGALITIEDGTFELTVTAERFERSLS